MDVRASLNQYVTKMLTGIKGMKALLLDTELTGVVSLCTTQSGILAHNVVLTQKLSSSDADSRSTSDVSLTHLKAVVFVRPTRENVELLRQELRRHSYGEYHLFFSNALKLDLLQQLADADHHSLVKQVQEFYADYFPVNKTLFSLNLQSSLRFSTPRPRWSRMEEARYQRAVLGLSSVLLSLKISPDQIRFQRGSDVGMNFAREIRQLISTEKELFNFRNTAKTTLLVLDRREDPVTPLLTQWTYQAMVHELFCIRNNRVDLRQTASTRADVGRPASKVEQVVLSENDAFFAEHMNANFGDLGEAIKKLLESYQKLAKSNAQISTVEDMQNFVDAYPEFKKFANNVSKHVAIMGELAHLVDSHRLLDISQLEQQLACSADHPAHLEEVRLKVVDPAVDGNDALRLVLLYALRYESHPQNQIVKLKHLLLQQKGLGEAQMHLVDAILEYAGEKKRAGDLYGDSSGLISKSLKMATRAVKGVSNVYTQHKPVLHETIDLLLKGRLSEASFPILGAKSTATGRASKATVPANLIIFIVGGTTYEEAVTVSEFNKLKSTNTRIVLGGTCIHNSTSFTTEVNELSRRRNQVAF